jgi:hypothetical protein
MKMRQLALNMQEDPRNFVNDLDDVELETDDPALFSFLECFRDVPIKFVPTLSEVFLLIDKRFNFSTPVETLDDLIERNIGLKGSLFEVVSGEHSGEHFVFNGHFDTEGGTANICAPFGSPLALIHLSGATRIKNVF